MTPAQKRDKEDFDLANEIMNATSDLMKLINKAKERDLYVFINTMGYGGNDGIKVRIRRDMKIKSISICDAEIST